jgi:hypothetical protein
MAKQSRVKYGYAKLENQQGGNSFVGSNPTPSANYLETSPRTASAQQLGVS